MTTASSFNVSGAAASLSTLLNDLDSNGADYVNGDTIEITGKGFDGADLTLSLNVGPATTVGDLINAVDGAFPDSSAALNANGAIQLTADNVGETPLSLTLADGATNTGQTGFENHSFVATTVGTFGDGINSAIEFVDSLGRSHALHLSFERLEDNHTWEVRGSVDPQSGSLSQEVIGTIIFNDDGSFQRVADTGSGSTTVSVSLAGITQPQIAEHIVW